MTCASGLDGEMPDGNGAGGAGGTGSSAIAEAAAAGVSANVTIALVLVTGRGEVSACALEVFAEQPLPSTAVANATPSRKNLEIGVFIN